MIKLKKPIFNENIRMYTICVIIAFLFLMICSTNSFLYAMNDWVDVNWYITMGNGILHGKVPYKDLFEQKGPLTYFVFALICLFPNNYYAVFALEIITLSIFLFIAYKIMIRYIPRAHSILGVVIMALIVTTSSFFVAGGGALEEYSLPIIAYFVYILLKLLDGESLTKRQSMLMGSLVAVLFWLKYTLVLIPMSILVIWFIKVLVDKEYKSLINIVFMLIGFTIVTLPIIIYFAVNSAVKDLFITYFYYNIFLYHSNGSSLKNVFYLLGYGIVPFVLLVLGTIFLKREIGNKAWLYITVALIQVAYLLIMYNDLYYFLPITIFSILGVVAVLTRFKDKQSKLFYFTILFIIPIICFSSTFIFANSNIEMGRDRSEYSQFAIAEDIKSFGYDDPSLFCYKLRDLGVYNICNIVPTEKFYALNNFTEEELPEMYQSIHNAIIEQRNDFVVVSKQTYIKEKDFLNTYYDYYKEYSYEYYENDFVSNNLRLVLLIKSV